MVTRSSCRKLKVRSPNLHDDIVTMILSRLPVKSILRFRCVSKSWCCLLSSKQFIKSQLEISIKNNYSTNISVILANMVPRTSVSTLQHCPLHSVAYKAGHYPVLYDHRFPALHTGSSSIVLVGCCNGLCCSIVTGKVKKGFFLWNPSTKKAVMKFPQMERNSFCTLYGFGFDDSRGDYKALLGIRTPVQRETVVHIYSFKSNSRKKINFPLKEKMSDAFIDQKGTFVNGKLHWLIMHDNADAVDNVVLDIINFDMETEIYGGVLEPPICLQTRFNPSIVVLGGCLCVVSGNHCRLQEIWVLKNGVDKESWCKMMSFRFSLPVFRGMEPKPLCITPQGELMILSDKCFYIYDPKNDNSPRIITGASFDQFNICYQSLVSPFSDEEEENYYKGRPFAEDVVEDDEWLINLNELKRRWAKKSQSEESLVGSSPRLTKRQRRSAKRMKDYDH